MYERFLDVCSSIAREHVPERIVRETSSSRIPRDRRILMRRRRKVTLQLQKTTSEEKRNRLKKESIQIEMKLQASYRNTQSVEESKAVNAIKKNIKYFFGYAKRFLSTKAGVGPFVDKNHNIVSCPEKMADMLAAQYSNVFSLPREEMKPANELFPDSSDIAIGDIIFNQTDIEDAIDNISSTAAAGPDRFPAIFLKNCKTTLSAPIAQLWRTSLNTGNIPKSLKSANIIPIYKGKSMGIPANYRPVALTSHLIKIFEKVVRKHLVHFMEINNHFNPGQHGFRQGRSCLSQLLSHYDNLLSLLEEGQNVDIAYLDFSKAFDKVDFLITLTKLKSMGVGGKLGRWIQSFLTGRTQTVYVKGHPSKPSSVRSGVPQGSVLGPLLFLVLIKDIDDNVTSSKVSSFADDTRASKGANNIGDCNLLQEDLNTIYQWAENNNMEFNFEKFECLRYGFNKELIQNTHYTTPDGKYIEVKEHTRDLGVTMSANASFNQHILNTVDSARQLTGWILRTFKTRDKLPMLTLWKTLVLSKLDYCSQLWDPSKKGYIQDLELVQRDFIKRINGLSELDYWQQLKSLALYSLQRRRERYMIIYVWKILENLVPNLDSKNPVRSRDHGRRGRLCNEPAAHRIASKKLELLCESSFAYKAPRLFNKLPKELRALSVKPRILEDGTVKPGISEDTFKNHLDRFLATIPDQPQIRGYTDMRLAETNSLVHMTSHAFGNACLNHPAEEHPSQEDAGGGCTQRP